MYGEGQRGRTGVGARSAEVPEAGQQGDTEVWNRVKRRLRAELGEDVFTSWFARLELDAVNDGCAHLTVPTRFLKSWIEAHYADRVRSVYRSESPLVANIARSFCMSPMVATASVGMPSRLAIVSTKVPLSWPGGVTSR